MMVLATQQPLLACLSPTVAPLRLDLAIKRCRNIRRSGV